MKGNNTVVWNSWQLHLGSQARSAQDRLLTEVIGPTVAELGGKPWFFLRYWQAGPHLRLRVAELDAGAADLVERSLRDRLAIAGVLTDDEKPLDGSEYQLGAARPAAGEQGRNGSVEEFRSPGAYRSVYEPEYARYGGHALMPRTEELFELSSELVLALMPHVSGQQARSMMALRGTISAAAALGNAAEQADFYARNVAGWRDWAAGSGSSEEELDALCRVTGPATTSIRPDEHGPFARWHAALADLVAEIRRSTSAEPGQILSSHVHMLHNRLGRTLADELRTHAWLAHVFPVTGVLR